MSASLNFHRYRPKVAHKQRGFLANNAKDAGEVIFLDGKPYYPGIRAEVAKAKDRQGEGLQEFESRRVHGQRKFFES